ncbi:beta-lactamase family protein [Pedobacter sp. ISL-68]|uniref:serine hydrolase domain-containing protein n=1 Tax=unclassified Pedobacter TaxID=2628915 RepID=UPI001BEAF8A3|nr:MULTISPECIES: serine hydrolase domain-containing protein [unclassified Pedobacter]MBT2561913.1 beta-lactamase family protein [Pedobacter sp. ISL-64]MBT2591500.1 beta-lactamase family protein [Pedobacter sp. ISL-68]
MSHIKLILATLILLISFEAESQNYTDSLSSALTDYLNKNEIPGFAVMILNQDKIVYEKGFGYANIEKKQPFKTNTIQNIGSVSKTFIAVALMKAIELGYFTLETNINDILPFKVVNPNAPNDTISIKYLTTHTSGILDNKVTLNRSYRFIGQAKSDKLIQILKGYNYTSDLRDTTLGTFLKSYLTPDGQLYTKDNFGSALPGKSASYSNIGSALAAYLIEIKSGLSFADFTTQYIFNPLRMKETSWFLPKKINNRQATPYLDKSTPLPFYHLTTYPDGGLRTSASELSLYVSEMIKTLNNKSRLINKNSVATMFKPVFNEINVPQGMLLKTRNKGVFWNLYKDGYIGHDGDDPGVSTYILFNRHTGIIFLSNIYMEDKTNIISILKKYAPSLSEPDR